MRAVATALFFAWISTAAYSQAHKLSLVPGHAVASDSSRMILGQTVVGAMFSNPDASGPNILWGLLPVPRSPLVSVEARDARNIVTVAPNPSLGVIYVRGVNEVTQIRLTDVGGHVLMTRTVDHPDSVVELDLSPFAVGTYVIVLSGRLHRSAHVVVKL